MKKYLLSPIILLLFACNEPQQADDIQKQIKADYDRIQAQLLDVESELLNDSLDMGSPRYQELIRMDDSLQTAIFKMYDKDDLLTFFEENVKGTINEYQYKNLLMELENY